MERTLGHRALSDQIFVIDVEHDAQTNLNFLLQLRYAD